MRQFPCFSWIFKLLGICLISHMPFSQASDALVLAVHPYSTAQQILKKFNPLADYLTQRLHRPVTVQISKDYAAHLNEVGRNQVDIAYMGPASYVEMVAKYGAKPLLARLEINGKPTFRGALVKAANSPLNTLADLQGKRFAFGSTHSTMGHLVPRHMLLEVGVTVDKLAAHEFLDNHENVVLSVLSGEFDAGAVKEDVFKKYQPRGLALLTWTPEISEHLFVVRSDLPEATIEALRQALWTLAQEPGGGLILQTLQDSSLTGLVAVKDEDYANLRRILEELKRANISTD